MDLTFDERDVAFRDELRAWLADNPLAPKPAGGEAAAFAWRRDWDRTLNTGGWAAPHWPSTYGGRDATMTQIAIYYEELGRHGRPMAANVGTALAGPTIMVWGTDEQKQRYLPPILAADEIWCQGFSEPDAGSDLAALKTKAVRDGDTWVVSGQKVWTSFAHYAKWCVLLARTDFDAPKHKGLSYFLLDMEQEGVQVRPLKQMTGESEFNELFLDEARIPHENMLGSEGSGWKVALTTLMNERAGLGLVLLIRMRQFVDELLEAAHSNGAIHNPRIAEQLGELHMRCETSRLMAWKGLTDTERYGQPGPEGSLVKWLWSDTNQKATQLAVDIIGPEALLEGNGWAHDLLRARANSIEGGTTDIQKNIVAERVLGLPRLQSGAG